MEPDIRRYVGILWMAFGLIWLLGALFQKQTARREASGIRLVYLVFGGLAVLLLVDKKLQLGPLESHFVPQDMLFGGAGLALTFIGVAFAVWARVFLGRNWSGAVTVKKDHELIRNGPYAIVRHPIYTGALVALLGTAIVFAEARGLVSVGIATIALCVKLLHEERFMTEQFGAEYAKYSQKVKRLIPFVW